MATIIDSGCRITRINDLECLRIADDKRQYVGGDQNWYRTETMRFGGCGPTTAANIIVYLRSTRDRHCGYVHDPLSKAAFLCLMEMAYGFVRPLEIYQAKEYQDLRRIFGLTLPASFGVIDSRLFALQFKKMANSLAMNIRTERMGLNRNREAVREFIREGLEGDCPVALLNRFKSVSMNYVKENGVFKEVPLRLHWVSITGMREDKDGSTVLEVLTWGTKAELSLDALMQANCRTLLPAGLVRFKVRRHAKIHGFVLER